MLILTDTPKFFCVTSFYAPIYQWFAPGWGVGGRATPGEFDFVKLYPGRDFDIHSDPLAG